MNKPILLTRKNLIKPIETALKRIEEIRQIKAANADKIILEGLFVLGVATFEHSLNDVLRILLTYIPGKLDLKYEQISKKELIDGNPLKHAIENKLNSIGYKNLPDILKYFLEITDLPANTISDEEINCLLEIKASRNLLIHNNLIINSNYKESAGPNIRKANIDNRLEIDQNYLFESLVTIRDVLEKIKAYLNTKYEKYTKIKATKALFEYIFTTPIMKFENEFIINQDKDEIIAFNKDKSWIKSLSSSERFFYDIWLAHFTSKSFNFPRKAIFYLDNKNRRKLEYFLAVIDILKS